MKYRVYFEFYDRKMVTEVEAGSEALAKQNVMNRLKFLNVVQTHVSASAHSDDDDDEAGGVNLDTGSELFNKFFGRFKK